MADLPLSVRWRTTWDNVTNEGRRDMLWYVLRRLVTRPAPDGKRCYMGAPVDDLVHCPRWAIPGEDWCRKHSDVNKRIRRG